MSRVEKFMSSPVNSSKDEADSAGHEKSSSNNRKKGINFVDAATQTEESIVIGRFKNISGLQFTKNFFIEN